MEDDGLQALDLAVIVSLACLIVSVVFCFVRFFVVRFNNTNEEALKYAADTTKWSSNVGTVIKGSNVLYLVETYDDFFCVSTKENPIGFISFENSRDYYSDNYVCQTDDFICTGVYDSGNNLVGMQMTEIGCKDAFYNSANVTQKLKECKSYYSSVTEAINTQSAKIVKSIDSMKVDTGANTQVPIDKLELCELYQKENALTNLSEVSVKLKQLSSLEEVTGYY